MNNPTVSNPNDFKVVEFHNPEDFTFTPEMGCMYDGRPISGITGAPGINGGESLTLPYHIGQQLALNLAKYVGIRNAATVDPTDAKGNPMIAPIWSAEALEERKNSYIKELYTEERPVAETETDRLMAKVEEYKKMVDQLIDQKQTTSVVSPVVHMAATTVANTPALPAFQDKQDVINELEVRGIKHDKRKNVAELSKLLAPVAA